MFRVDSPVLIAKSIPRPIEFPDQIPSKPPSAIITLLDCIALTVPVVMSKQINP